MDVLVATNEVFAVSSSESGFSEAQRMTSVVVAGRGG